MTIYQIAFASSSTAALVPYTAGTRPTKIGAMPTPNSWLNGSAGSTSTWAAASSTAASRASTTASAFKWAGSSVTSVLDALARVFQLASDEALVTRAVNVRVAGQAS